MIKLSSLHPNKDNPRKIGPTQLAKLCESIQRDARCSVAILTKGGQRCLDDLAMFRDWPDGRIKVGATLTFMDAKRSREVEPGAADPDDRLTALWRLHFAGVKTWVSIEPVLDADQSLACIRESLPFVDAYKVGKLNHQRNDTDWRRFCVAAVEMIRGLGRRLYVKDDLRPFAPTGFLRPEECDPETVFLSDRPAAQTVPTAASADYLFTL